MTDLEWLARNVTEQDWNRCSGRNYAVRNENLAWFYEDSSKIPGGAYYCNKKQWRGEREAIQNKPSWSELPRWVQYIAQWKDGEWLGYEVCPLDGSFEDSDDCYVDPGRNPRIWRNGIYGEVLGNWRDTLEQRPAAEKQLPEAAEENNTAPRKTSSGLAELYPKYHKDVSGFETVDVYAVHKLFDINDPSGCLQHASKKLLLSGVRTGGKSKFDDIKEARDTLNRWIELHTEDDQ